MSLAEIEKKAKKEAKKKSKFRVKEAEKILGDIKETYIAQISSSNSKKLRNILKNMYKNVAFLFDVIEVTEKYFKEKGSLNLDVERYFPLQIFSLRKFLEDERGIRELYEICMDENKPLKEKIPFLGASVFYGDSIKKVLRKLNLDDKLPRWIDEHLNLLSNEDMKAVYKIFFGKYE